MKKVMALSLALCLLLAGCGTRLDKSTRLRKYKDSATSEQVYKISKDAFSDLGATKLSVGIVKDGRVKFMNFGGASEDTIYQIGTMTQMFTCITALDYIDMDEPVSTYLEAYEKNKLKMPSNAITGSMLATHTAGFDNWPDDALYKQNPYFGYSDRKLFSYVARTGLLYEPGTQARESAVGIGLLGNVLEAKQKGWAKSVGMIGSSVFQRVGMYSTFAKVPNSKTDFRVMGHDAEGNIVQFQNYNALRSAAGYYSSTYDMMLFAAACMDQISSYDGKKPSFAENAKEAFSVHYEDEENAYGYGCHAVGTEDGTVFWQSSELGGFGGFFAISPDTGAGVVVLCDRSVAVDELGFDLISALSKGE